MPRTFLFFCFLRAAFPATITLATQSSGPGSSVLISATFTPGNDSVSALQFDLQYDNNTMSVVVTPGDQPRGSGKSIYSQDVASNQKRFLIAGPNASPIPAGTILNLYVNLNANASGPIPLTISNLVVTDSSGSSVVSSGTSGAVTVQGNSGSRIDANGVLNAASLTSGPVAPGEIITLIGSGIGPPIPVQPTLSATAASLGGSSVLFDNVAAPLLYAGPSQINAIVPYEIAGNSTTQVLISSGNQLIAGFSMPVAAAAPAIFTQSGGGLGPGLILNQDLTINSPSNPAARGSIVVLYATGAGAMNPVPIDGQATIGPPQMPVLPVSVLIGGAAATVMYAGAAPTLVAGVLQVNCQVPASISPGDSVSVALTVGSISSPAGAVIAVRDE